MTALGSLCGVSDGATVLRASQRCDELGIDTISTGGSIAFAMECVERGLLDEPWLTFGSGDAVLKAIELIGQREGVGAILAEGSRKAAQIIGHDSIAFAPQVKGLEIPGYEPRTMQTGIAYDDVVREVADFLRERADALRSQWVGPERIVLDPGVGFGKAVEHNVALLARQEELLALGLPLRPSRLPFGTRGLSLGAARAAAPARARNGVGRERGREQHRHDRWRDGREATGLLQEFAPVVFGRRRVRFHRYLRVERRPNGRRASTATVTDPFHRRSPFRPPFSPLPRRAKRSGEGC